MGLQCGGDGGGFPMPGISDFVQQTHNFIMTAENCDAISAYLGLGSGAVTG
jgi:hypothetical protein